MTLLKTAPQTVYDISVILGETAVDYPGDTPYSRKVLTAVESGGDCTLSGLEMSAHSGTHIDAPAHFIPGGLTLDQYGADEFILSARVVDIPDPVAVTSEAVSGVRLEPGGALLFRTENSATGRCRARVFVEDYVHLTPDAADLCVEKGAALVGIDYISVARYGGDDFAAHHALLSACVLILEGIDLGAVPAGDYTLFCIPLRVDNIAIAGDAEASPVRAVLLGK